MSIFSNISSIFSGAAPAAQQTPNQSIPTPGNLNPEAANTGHSSAGTANNGVVPPNGAAAPQQSPLDSFKDIWDTPNTTGDSTSLFNVDQNKLMEIARKNDFRPQVSQEQMQAIAAGGPNAVQAMLDLMNQAVQIGYARNAEATTKLIEGGLAKANFAKASDISTMITSQQLRQGLLEDNPMLSHPALQPMVDALQSRLVQKYPNATPNEIKQQVQQYMQGMTDVLRAPELAAQQNKQKQTNKDQDWEKFFSM